MFLRVKPRTQTVGEIRGSETKPMSETEGLDFLK